MSEQERLSLFWGLVLVVALGGFPVVVALGVRLAAWFEKRKESK